MSEAINADKPVVLITGINGRLGQALGQVFRKDGYRVIGTFRSGKYDPEMIPLDLRDPDAASILKSQLIARDISPALAVLNAADTRKTSPELKETEAYIQINHRSQIEISQMLLVEFPCLKIIFVSSVLAHLQDYLNPLYHQCKSDTEKGLSGLNKDFHKRIGIFIPGPLKNSTINPAFGTYTGAAQSILRLSKSRDSILYYPAVWNWLIRADEYSFRGVSQLVSIFR